MNINMLIEVALKVKKVNDYYLELTYCVGGEAIETAVKKYKSHRRVNVESFT